MAEVKTDSAQTQRLLEDIAGGDRQALERLLERHRPCVHAFIEARLDPKLRARLDPSDVVQEAQMEVVRRMDDYLRRRPMPFHLWVRKTAYERLLNLRRDHRKSARRSVDREVALPNRSSLLLARPLLAGGPSPSQQLAARVLAWGSTDGTVKIVKIADGTTKEMRTFQGHKSWVEGVAFSPDGKWIASASLDGTVKLWQVPFVVEARSPVAGAPTLAPQGGGD